MLTTHVQSDSASTTLRSMVLRMGSASTLRFMMQWGAGVRRKAQLNALAKGGRRFWRDVARSVRMLDASVSGATIDTTSPGGAHKQVGGPISAPGKGPWAKGRESLSIPINTMSEGRMPGEFKGLFRLPKTNLLVIPGGKKSIHPFIKLFVLVKSTRPQRANPWWPQSAYVNRLGLKLALNMLAADGSGGGVE